MRWIYRVGDVVTVSVARNVPMMLVVVIRTGVDRTRQPETTHGINGVVGGLGTN